MYGDNNDHGETENFIRQISAHGIFWQFVGIGNERFVFLNELDNMSGRKLDNANLLKAASLANMTDRELYSALLNEFPSWITQAKQAKLIK